MSKKKDFKLARRKEGGTAMVEAAIAMPIFLAILFISMYLMLLSFKVLRFQYELSDITRQTFLLTPLQRAQSVNGGGAGIDWQPFLDDQLDKRLQTIGLRSRLNADNYVVQFAPARGKCAGWGCAWTAQPGDIFSVTVTLKEPIFGAALAGISWQELSVDTKSIAFVLKPQNEEE